MNKFAAVFASILVALELTKRAASVPSVYGDWYWLGYLGAICWLLIAYDLFKAKISE